MSRRYRWGETKTRRPERTPPTDPAGLAQTSPSPQRARAKYASRSERDSDLIRAHVPPTVAGNEDAPTGVNAFRSPRGPRSGQPAARPREIRAKFRPRFGPHPGLRPADSLAGNGGAPAGANASHCPLQAALRPACSAPTRNTRQDPRDSSPIRAHVPPIPGGKRRRTGRSGCLRSALRGPRSVARNVCGTARPPPGSGRSRTGSRRCCWRPRRCR